MYYNRTLWLVRTINGTYDQVRLTKNTAVGFRDLNLAYQLGEHCLLLSCTALSSDVLPSTKQIVHHVDKGHTASSQCTALAYTGPPHRIRFVDQNMHTLGIRSILTVCIEDRSCDGLYSIITGVEEQVQGTNWL